jgi:hypothetical protein
LQTKIILSLYFYKYNLFGFSDPNYDPNKFLIIEATLNENLNSVNMWCTNNNMVINPTKTTCMLIGTKQRKAMMEKEFNIYISNENIQNVNIQKLLGIYLDHISISDVKFSSGRSFINIIKSRGPKMDPCGTPYFTGSGLVNINYFMNHNLDSDVSIHATRLLQISLIGG